MQYLTKATICIDSIQTVEMGNCVPKMSHKKPPKQQGRPGSPGKRQKNVFTPGKPRCKNAKPKAMAERQKVNGCSSPEETKRPLFNSNTPEEGVRFMHKQETDIAPLVRDIETVENSITPSVLDEELGQLQDNAESKVCKEGVAEKDVNVKSSEERQTARCTEAEKELSDKKARRHVHFNDNVIVFIRSPDFDESVQSKYNVFVVEEEEQVRSELDDNRDSIFSQEELEMFKYIEDVSADMDDGRKKKVRSAFDEEELRMIEEIERNCAG